MKRLLVWTACTLLLTGCTTVGGPSASTLAQIGPGMGRAEVVALLGPPVARSFREKGEALQYCGTGLDTTDRYDTIWLMDGQVVALTSNRGGGVGMCSANMPSVDWGQAPPEILVRIEHR